MRSCNSIFSSVNPWISSVNIKFSGNFKSSSNIRPLTNIEFLSCPPSTLGTCSIVLLASFAGTSVNSETDNIPSDASRKSVVASKSISGDSRVTYEFGRSLISIGESFLIPDQAIFCASTSVEASPFVNALISVSFGIRSLWPRFNPFIFLLKNASGFA